MAVSFRRDWIRDADLADPNARSVHPEIRACNCLRLLSSLGFLSPGLVHMSPGNQLVASSADSGSISRARARQLVDRKRAGEDPNSLAFSLCRPQAIRARPRHGKQWLAYYALRGNGRMNTPFMPAEPPAHRPAMSIGNDLYLLPRMLLILRTNKRNV